MGLNSLMTGLADQVRRLSGRTGLLGVAAMTAALEGVETGTDVSGADAATGDVVSGKKFVGAAGTVETGTMPDRGAVSQTLTASTKSYTIPAGRHNGSGVVKINTQTKSVTPKTTAQTVTPDSGYLLSSVSVAAAAASGKAVYTGTVSLESTGTEAITINTGVTMASADTFILLPTANIEDYKVFTCAVKVGTSVNQVFHSGISGDDENGYSTSVFAVGSITYSGTKVSITKGGHESYAFATYRWHVIKA